MGGLKSGLGCANVEVPARHRETLRGNWTQEFEIYREIQDGNRCLGDDFKNDLRWRREGVCGWNRELSMFRSQDTRRASENTAKA